MIDYGMIKSSFFWFLPAILIAIILIILNFNGSSIQFFPAYQVSTMEDLHLKHKEDNKIKWELSAKNAIMPTGNKEILLKSLTLKINQSPEIYLTSGSGVYEIEKGDITLNKTVKLNVRDAEFTTDTVKWNSKEDVITTDDDVTLNGNSFLIKGKGLVAEISQQKVRITKDVKAIFYR